MKSPFIKLVLIAIPFLSFAQHNHDHHACGTDLYYEQLYQNNQELKQQVDAVMNVDQYPTSDRRDGVMIIPVVFHIIHQGGSENIDKSAVEDMMTRINEDYRAQNTDLSIVRNDFSGLIADIEVEFRLARIDPDGNCTNGITRTYSTETVGANDDVKSLVNWDHTKYLNVWVVKSIDLGQTSGTILGYATFPGTSGTRDGVVIRSDRVGLNYRTLTHEIGHYLGLYHPFQGGCYGNGDRVDDTPPEAEAHYHCSFSTNSCSNDSPDQPDMLENHMGYSSCRVMFTKGQKDRMYYFLNNYRTKIHSTANLIATGTAEGQNIYCKPVAAFSIENSTVCEGSEILFENNSFSASSTQYNWHFPGGYPEKSYSESPSIEYYKAGQYSVKLIVSSSAGKDSVVKEKMINVLPNPGITTPLEEGFESAELNSPYWSFAGLVNGIGWQRTQVASKNGNYSFVLNNFDEVSEGNTYELILPPVDLSNIYDGFLRYHYAYARKNNESLDFLRIYVSTNCGESWSLREVINPLNMPTTGSFVPTSFVPEEAEWTEYELDLAAFGGMSNVLVKLSFESGLGNNFYLDNFKIASVSSIDDKNEISDISIYPNPVNDKLVISLVVTQSEDVVIDLYDILGEKIYSHTEKAQGGRQEIIIDTRKIGKISDGMYLINVQDSKGNHVQKINIRR